MQGTAANHICLLSTYMPTFPPLPYQVRAVTNILKIVNLEEKFHSDDYKDI
jgi:hypothetical protein